MLFWLFIILIIVGLLIRNISFDFETFGEILVGLSGFATFISLIIIIAQYSTIDSYMESNRETYKAITYKVESDACRDEFGLLNKEVLDEVQEWNEDVRFYHNIQDNFWVGIFYPNVFDEFETIDYENFGK